MEWFAGALAFAATVQLAVYLTIRWDRKREREKREWELYRHRAFDTRARWAKAHGRSPYWVPLPGSLMRLPPPPPPCEDNCVCGNTWEG